VGSLSRGGVLALLVGGLLTAISFGTVRDSESRIGWAMLALAGVIGLSLWLGFGSRLAARFEELNDPNAVTTLNRMRNWSDTLPAAWDFGLLGSGLGSYHAVHRLYRSDVEERVFERADNQYFQTLIEGGWLGFGLLLAALALAVWTAVFVSSKGNSVKSLAIGVTNMFLITSIAVSSLGDYGLEIPQNTILMALLVGLTSNHVHAFASRLKKKFFLRHVLPRWAGLLVVAGTTLGLLFAARHLWALAQQERMGATAFLRETQDSLPAEQAQRQIEQLEPLVAATPTYWGYRRLGELYVHRYRLAQYATIQNRLDASPAKLWESTNLVNLYEQMQQLKRIADRRLIEAVGASDDAQKFIVPAWRAFVASRNSLPFQTDVQLMLGQIQSIFGDESKSQICLERATLTAPTNADYAYIIGLMHLHAGRTSDAASAWRRCLSLKPYPYFDRVLERVHSLPSDRWRIDPQVVLEQIVPRDPTLLYNFCKTHLADQKYAQLRKQGLQWADQVQADLARRSDPKDVWLGIQIKLALGENEEALNQMKWLVQLSPPNMRMEDIRFQMAQLMFEESQFEEAYETIKWLRKNDSLNLKRYSGLYEKLRQKLGISSAE
jgi:tetratricopeptide (TPR) repeat protein